MFRDRDDHDPDDDHDHDHDSVVEAPSLEGSIAKLSLPASKG